jgi:hypothetical protein
MDTITFAVKPGFCKGGEGTFTRLKSPCEFAFGENRPPVLHAYHCPESNIWLVLVATIMTFFAVHAVAAAGGFAVGPGLLLWYLIVNYFWRNKLDIDLSQAESIVVDPEKKEVGILGVIAARRTWVGVKCGQHFPAIIERLGKAGKVSVVERGMRTTQLGMTILLIVLAVALAVVVPLMLPHVLSILD